MVLPEVFNWRGRGAETVANAEPVPGPSTEHMSALAAELGLYLLAGSVLEVSDSAGRAYNTSVLIGPGTGIIAKYRKIHLFDVDIEGEAPIRESQFRQPGDAVVVADTPLCTMGLSVCYDLRFPELYRRLTAYGAKDHLRTVGLHRFPRAGRTGKPCCAPAPSRTKSTSSPRTRPVDHPASMVGLRPLHDRRSMGQGHRQGRH